MASVTDFKGGEKTKIWVRIWNLCHPCYPPYSSYPPTVIKICPHRTLDSPAVRKISPVDSRYPHWTHAETHNQRRTTLNTSFGIGSHAARDQQATSHCCGFTFKLAKSFFASALGGKCSIARSIL